jgi:DNA-binding NarL/FixJ family response regulator
LTFEFDQKSWGLAMSTIRVILIEDHDLTRVGIRAALQQREGFEVIGDARDAKSGLRLLKTTQPDIAIVDVGLPDMTGIELTQQFKQAQADGEVANTKILIMTLQDSEDTVLAAFAAGADSYCMKDASIDKLAQALRVTSEGNAWIDPAIARIVLHQTQKSYVSAQGSPEAATISINRLSDEDFVPAYPLTERELEVLKLIVDGCSNAQIAEKLYITVGTVKTHVRNILNKLCADDRTQVAVRALRTGLVQ